jgi:effector-binding domain-containing protein
MTGATERVVEARPTAVIVQRTTWEAFPALWPVLLDEVWSAVRGRAEIAPGRNVMLYRDDVPTVEIGAEAAGPFAPIGRVVPSSLPAGRVVTATHRGPYEGLGAAHRAAVEACDARGLRRLGPRWEVYGHWTPRPEDQVVEVFHLVAAQEGTAPAN